MRKLIAVALGAALAMSFAATISTDAEAKKKASVPKAKLCQGPTFEGKKVSFRCKGNETCCYDGLMAKGNCVPQGQVCF